jgi:hypothetical protein
MRRTELVVPLNSIDLTLFRSNFGVEVECGIIHLTLPEAVKRAGHMQSRLVSGANGPVFMKLILRGQQILLFFAVNSMDILNGTQLATTGR